MEVYIYSAKRSAIGKFKKSFKNTLCRSIGSQIVDSLFDEKNIKKEDVEKLYVGNVLSAGLGQNVARQILIDSGIPINICATTVNMVCGSGMKAIQLGCNEIKLGSVRVMVVGGVENMSNAPLLKDRFDEKAPLNDHLLNDSLIDAFNYYHMGITAENIAEKYNISRELQDQYAYQSQIKTKTAQMMHKFDEEIVPIRNNNGELVEQDEFPRNETTLISLASLKPAFKEQGTVTAGNSSGINDGGAFLLIGDSTLKEKPMAKIIDFVEEGCAPEFMGMGPYYAINKILNKNNLKIEDIDLFEINEAFAAQSIAVIKELANQHNVSEKTLFEKINVNGGAIALGHPVGASGARIVTTLLYELKKRNLKLGIASLCVGGGMGIAMLIENLKEN